MTMDATDAVQQDVNVKIKKKWKKEQSIFRTSPDEKGTVEKFAR